MNEEKRILIISPFRERREFLTNLVKETMPGAFIVEEFNLRNGFEKLRGTKREGRPFHIAVLSYITHGYEKSPLIVITNNREDFNVLKNVAIKNGITYVFGSLGLNPHQKETTNEIRKLLVKEQNTAYKIKPAHPYASSIYSTGRIEKSIIVIDDFEQTRETTAKIIRDIGGRAYTLFTSDSMRGGFKTFNELEQYGRPPALIITTIMPGVVDTVRKIREMDEKAYISVLVFQEKDNKTVNALCESDVEVFTTDSTSFFSKPDFKNFLKQLFEEVWGKQTGERMGDQSVLSDRRFFMKPRAPLNESGGGISAYAPKRFKRPAQIV